MPYARRDDLSLFYEQDGSADPPLLFVHGWCCDRSFFKPQFDHVKSSHKVTALDLRGCGKSDRPEDGYDLPTLADDVAWLCGELGISRPIVVGHSLGGMIAIELAARHPSVPLAVVAVDPGPINPLPETQSVYEGFAAELAGPGGEAVRRAVPLSVAAAGIRGVVDWNGIGALALCTVPLGPALSDWRKQRRRSAAVAQARSPLRRHRRRRPLQSAPGPGAGKSDDRAFHPRCGQRGPPPDACRCV